MRRLGLFIGALALACLLLPAPVFALPSATITLTASPNPSVSTSTFKVVVRLSAASTNVMFHLETSGGFGDPDGSTCAPAANCTIIAGANAPHWSYASASGTLTATFNTSVNPGMVVRFYSDGGMAVTNPPSVRMKDPTVSSKLTRSPTGVVMPGDTLHITVSATTNAGPLTDDLQVRLPDGVSAPTNLPGDAQYSPQPAHYIDRTTTINKTDSYSFDVEVTAAVGTKITFSAGFGFGGYDPGTKLSLTVGVAPTPRPTATPKPTPKPTPKATAAATAAATATTAVTAAPSPSPLQSELMATSTPTPAPSLAPNATAAPSEGSATNPPAPTPTAGGDAASGFVLGLGLVLAVGLGALVLYRRRIHPTGGPT